MWKGSSLIDSKESCLILVIECNCVWQVDGVEAVKLEKKGMLADLLEREVKKESINGATVVGGPKPELRIGDNGLELIPKDARGDLSFDLVADAAAAAAAPKAAHLIAQVDDSGHVQIHLEESGDNPASMCNGQSLLDQLEACEVSSSTDPVDNRKSAVKRPADDALDEGDIPAVNKKCVKLDNDSGDVEPAGILEKAMEMTLTPVINDSCLFIQLIPFQSVSVGRVDVSGFDLFLLELEGFT